MTDGLFSCCTSRPYLGAPSDFKGLKAIDEASGKDQIRQQLGQEAVTQATPANPIEQNGQIPQVSNLSGTSNYAISSLLSEEQ